MDDPVIAKLAQEFHPEAALSGFIFEDTPVLYPGTDYHDGVLYMTFPIDLRKMVKEGRSKEEVERRVTETICVSSKRRFFMYNHEDVEAQGFRMPPTFTQENRSRWPLPALRAFLQNKTAAPTGQQVYDQLVKAYKEYVEYPEDVYYELVPLFIMGSYIFRIFTSTGYLHFNGTMASGKSQNLKLLKAFGFNTSWVSNISTAALFRTVAGSPGIVCIDEAEGFDGDRGEELRRLLNAGYLAGEPVSRTEKTANDRFQVTQYEIYCPKVLASINPLEPVIQSRCVVIPMAPALRRIEEFDPDDERWAAVRENLYLWAMANAPRIEALYHEWNQDKRHRLAPLILHRQWQISQMYIVLADLIGGDKMALDLIEFFNGYFATMQKSIEQTDQLRLLLKCLPRVMSSKTAIDQEWYSIKDIHATVLDYLEEDSRQYYSSKKTGLHLVALGFRDRKTHKGGSVVKLDEKSVRREMQRRHVDPFDEDAKWYAGETSYATLSFTSFGQRIDETAGWGAAPVPEPDDNLDWLDSYGANE